MVGVMKSLTMLVPFHFGLSNIHPASFGQGGQTGMIQDVGAAKIGRGSMVEPIHTSPTHGVIGMPKSVIELHGAISA